MSVTVPVWTLGDRLHKSRRLAGLSQRDLAEYMGLSHGAIALYETDRRVPKLGVLRLWAMRCGVPLEWILYGETAPQPPAGSRRKLRGRDSNSQPNAHQPLVLLRAAA